ncbi:hypothetical protein GCM10020358_44620 [Amorphoplanes nipponensis]
MTAAPGRKARLELERMAARLDAPTASSNPLNETHLGRGAADGAGYTQPKGVRRLQQNTLDEPRARVAKVHGDSDEVAPPEVSNVNLSI